MKMLLKGITEWQLELLKERKHFFTVHLRGGIGNQLFQYSAGLHFAFTHGISVRFHDAGIDHGVSIQSLGLPGTYVNDGVFQKVGKTLLQDSNFLFRRRLVEFNHIGFDQNLDKLLPSTKIQGYFQTSYYYRELSRKGITLEINEKQLSHPVREFGKLMPQDSTLIHIRLGDYLKGRDTLGNLTQSYFKDAVMKFSNSEHNYILTDGDHQEISKFLAEWDLPFTIVPRFPNVSNFEYLHLFGRATSIIGSNSSFSWWGGQFARDEASVYLPKPWFKANQLESQLGKNFYDKKWKTIHSNWIQ